MKKFIILLFTIFLVISCESSYQYGGYYFTILSNGTVRFDGVQDKEISGTFYLPKKIYGREVTKIGKKAFQYCKKLTGITILSTVHEIGNRAFEGCTNLKSVTFESPYGWKSEDLYDKTFLLTLTDPNKNAEYLKDTYCNACWYKEAASVPPSITEEENHSMKDTTYSVNGVHFTMKPIVAVTDAVIGDNSRIDNKEHTVSLSTYYIGETEVTQELWQAVMGGNPSYFKDSDKKPVEQVSWFDCIKFCNELTAEVMGAEHCVYKINGEKVTADFSKKGFRLPTEAEWEYAAMGGKSLHKYAGCNSENDLKDYAWYKDNSDNKTHKVKTKKPNGYGLYDMSGNIWEWCWGWWTVTTPSGGSNPHGADSGDYRVWRGGSFAFNASYCERAYRGYIDPDNSGVNLGLRLVMSSN